MHTKYEGVFYGKLFYKTDGCCDGDYSQGPLAQARPPLKAVRRQSVQPRQNLHRKTYHQRKPPKKPRL